MIGVAVIVISLIVVALLRPYIHWNRARAVLKKIVSDMEPSEASVTLLYLRMKIYESFYNSMIQREGVEGFLRGVGESIKEALNAEAWSVILTPKSGNWHFVAWDDFYDKHDLDEVIPHIQKSGGARLVFEEKRVLDIPDTYKKKFWQEIKELVEKKESGVLETRSWIGIPVKSENEVVAVISVDWFKPKAYRSWMVEVLRKSSEDISKVFQEISNVTEVLLFEDYDPSARLPGEKALKRDLERLKSSNMGFSIIVVELLNLDKIWKIYGQVVKSKAIKMAVGRLRDSFEHKPRMYSKSVGKIVVVLETLSHQLLISYQRKILSEFLRVFHIEVGDKLHFVKLFVRVGYAVYPEDTEDINELFNIAETRMSSQKG